MGSLKELGVARNDSRFVTVPIVEPTSGFGIDDGARSSVVQGAFEPDDPRPQLP
jgi:hypothetical protein